MPSDGFQRLHPTSLLFSFGNVVRSFILPAVVLLLFRPRSSMGNLEVWFAIFAIPAAIAAVVRYLSLRYRLGDHDLVLREGIISRNERHIPFHRIQSLDTSRNVVHRMLGVADLSIQTASGAEPEAVLKVLSLEAVDRMRKRVFAGRAAREALADLTGERVDRGPVERVAAHASPRDLVVYGLITNRGMVALAAIMGVVWQVDVWPGDEWFSQQLERLPIGEPIGPLGLLPSIVATLVAAWLVLRLLSVGWALVSLWDFRLTIRGDELRTRYGLLTQRTATLPRHRIQVVTSEQGLLHRLFRRASLRARTAGAIASDQSGSSRDWLYPVADADQVEPLLRLAHPDLEVATVRWHPIHPRAWRRVALRWLVGLLVLAVGVVIVEPVAVLAIVPLAAAAIWNARKKTGAIRWGLSDSAVWYRSGWIGRRLRVVRFSKIQTVATSENPFDRRQGMAAVEVDTANAGMGTVAIRVPYLGRQEADRLAARLRDEASTRRFRW